MNKTFFLLVMVGLSLSGSVYAQENIAYIDTALVIPQLPDESVVLEQKLRGPASYKEAQKDCKSDDMRLPTWYEAISIRVNPSQYLTEYDYAYVNGLGPLQTERLWTQQSCGYKKGKAYSTSWSGITDVVKNGNDIGSYYYDNNCTSIKDKHYYQCVLDREIKSKVITNVTKREDGTVSMDILVDGNKKNTQVRNWSFSLNCQPGLNIIFDKFGSDIPCDGISTGFGPYYSSDYEDMTQDTILETFTVINTLPKKMFIDVGLQGFADSPYGDFLITSDTQKVRIPKKSKN